MFHYMIAQMFAVVSKGVLPPSPLQSISYRDVSMLASRPAKSAQMRGEKLLLTV